jgi:hypothetical protein
MMFGRSKDPMIVNLDAAMNTLFVKLDADNPESPEYEKTLGYLERMTAIRKLENTNQKVSPDTKAIIVGNLVGILIIVAYERMHVVTSRGLSFIKGVK